MEQTFPVHMTGKCQEAMTMYINSIVNGIVIKMEEFRQYEIIKADAIPRSVRFKKRKKKSLNRHI